MDDLKAKIEEDVKNLRWIAAILSNVGHGGAAITAGDIADRLSTHAAEPAPVAVEGEPERIWREPHTGACYLSPDEGDVEYIRADLAPTGNTALVEALCRLSAHPNTQSCDVQTLDLAIAALSQPAAPQPAPEVEALRKSAEYLMECLEEGASPLDAMARLRAALARGSVAEKGDR